MEALDQIAEAALARDALRLRALVQEFLRANPSLQATPPPRSDDPRRRAVAASLVELLAQRANQAPPAWASGVPSLPEPFFLVEAASRMRHLRSLCLAESPEPLRKRGLLAPPNFLAFA